MSSIEKYVGKIAVVTGASSGIGKAIAETLVKSGIIVAALARRAERLEELAKNLSSEKGKLYPFKCDLTNEEDILGTFKKITSQLGPIHILVNNAGLSKNTSIIDGNTEMWKAILDTNVLAVAMCSREAIRSMKEDNTKGHIININSAAGHKVVDFPGMSLYPASKFALTALTQTLRLEITRDNLPIKTTSISPGYVKTEFSEANFNVSVSALFEQDLPGLDSEDLAAATLYVLSTPDHVNVREIEINAQGEKLI